MHTTHRGTEALRYFSALTMAALGVLTSLAAQAPATGTQPAAQTTTGNASRGKDLYLSYSCYACHGYNAQTGNGARLLPMRMNQQVFSLYIRAPKTPGMPAYSAKMLSDAQAADIYAYVLSLPKAPELKDVPLLNQLPQ